MMYKQFFALGLSLLILTGCETTGQPRPATGNAMEINQQAEQAYAAGDMATAQKLYQELTRQVPREANPWFRLGNIYARQEQPDFAINAYREALVRDPKNAKAWHNMGVVQLRQATYSFLNLQNNVDNTDPLHGRAELMVEAVTQLLEQDFDASVDTPVTE
ncbi:MAG: tetratricopeptide repeat protein [Gammaproteobacteria bacterium]